MAQPTQGEANDTVGGAAAIHVRAGVSGCSVKSAAELDAAFARFLLAAIEILRASLPFVQSPAAAVGGGTMEARQRLALAALKACTLDYDAHDHGLLEVCGVLPVLDGYLSGAPSTIPTLRAAAWTLLESFLPRSPPAPAALLGPEAQRLHARLLGLVFRQLELSIAAGSGPFNSTDSSNSSHQRAFHPESVVAVPTAPWALSREATGPVIPYTPLTMGTTFAFWLFRSRRAATSLPDASDHPGTPPSLKARSHVMRGPDWCDGDEDGWVGNVGTVFQMETSTAAIVEWDGNSQARFIYRCVRAPCVGFVAD